QGILPSYSCIGERAAAIRGVERCLSEFCTVWSTTRLLDSHASEKTKRDFIFHLRPLLKHSPARERHEAVLVLCRRLFTPRNDVTESKSKHYVFAAAFEPEAGGYPLAGAFEEASVFPSIFRVCIPLPCLFAAYLSFLPSSLCFPLEGENAHQLPGMSSDWRSRSSIVSDGFELLLNYCWCAGSRLWFTAVPDVVWCLILPSRTSQPFLPSATMRNPIRKSCRDPNL
ncbi:unnamed protein product, partial [Pylaiella littoralis]